MKQNETCSRKCRCRRKKYCEQKINNFVDDEEYVVRTLFSPDHIDDEGKITTGAISRKELEDQGLSVNRVKLLSSDVLRKIYNNLSQRRPDQTLFGVASFYVKKTRELHNSALMFCPSASDANPTHADIYSKKNYETPEEWDILIEDLIEMCSVIDAENFDKNLEV